MKAAEFCTCQNTKCKFHPTNHDQGCDLCIKANLDGKTKTLPRCFFHTLMGDDVSRIKKWSFEEFACEVQARKN